MKKTSLSDIASSLNVSKTLVSMVLNGKGDQMGISPITQEKVKKKAKELNYRPNHFARGLRMGSSQTIGLIVSDVSNSFYAKICKVVENEISKKGYNLIICSTDENVSREKEIIDLMLSKHVDGMILSTSDVSGETIQLLENRNIPYVLIDREVKVKQSHFVGIDNHKGAYDMTQYLINKKYKKISFFTVTPSEVSTIKDRKDGFISAMKANDLKIDENQLFDIDFNNIQKSVDEAVVKCIKNKIDAIFTVNNNVAISVMRALKGLDVIIGKEMGLVSFDDVELFELSSPTISAVKQPIDKIAKESANLIVEIIKDQTKTITKILLPTEMKFRDSA